LQLHTATAQELTSIDQLVELGFLQVSDDYRRWVDFRRAARGAPA
jgi:hypothetical protein